MSDESIPARSTSQRPSAKTRNWCFTINNPTDDERHMFQNFPMAGLPRGVEFLVYQEERGEEGTVHFQGYLETTTSHNLNWLKNNFNERAHYEVRRGTQEEAIAYCSKEDTRVPDGMHGTYGKKRGGDAKEAKQRRIDTLDELRKKRIKFNDIDSELLLNTGFLQAASKITSTLLGPHRTIEVITIIGGTGIGKSYACYKASGDSLVTYQRNGWFGGAHTEGDNLLFDEFTGNVPLSEFLKLLDGYPNQLPVKGGFFPAFYTRVYITSNVMPEHWWTKKDEEIGEKREGELDCLYRRIGYPGPQREHPEYENGHFIVIKKMDERGRPQSVLSQRAELQMRLLMIGIDIRDHANLSPEPSEHEEEEDHQ